MIYITGDTHADFKYRFNTDYFPEQKEMTKDDYVIICGDFGGVWDVDRESNNEKYWLDWFNNRSYTLLFVDGNHENFDRLNSYPIKEWHGGKVHELRPYIYHLMRGQVFEIDGKKFFTFGGASSHDIEGGILDPDDPDFRMKKKTFRKEWIQYRINHESWWEQELASKAEMEEGLRNLSLYDNSVDYIITHCCATSLQEELAGKKQYKADRETDYLEYIEKNVNYNHWYFGHYHIDKDIDSKHTVLYYKIITT